MTAGESAREVARKRREKAQRLTQIADAWERGAAGEEATARALALLPAEWTVLHDVHWPGRSKANIDHVVIGPGGVFVIDSKLWNGTVSVAGDVLRQNGRSREKNVAAVAEAALAVTGVIGQVPAVPVLCFVRDEPITGWARDVMVCSTANVSEMLTSRPPVLHAATIARLLPVLTRGLFPAISPGAPPARTRSDSNPRRPRSSRPRSARRRGGPSATRFAFAVVALVVAVAMLPAVVSLLSNAASEGVQHLVAPSKPLGTTQTVAAGNGHPELAMTVASVVDTSVTGHDAKPPAGHRLVAVTIRLENRGGQRWTWDNNTRLTLVDGADTAYGPTANYPTVQAGRVVRGSPKIGPHHTLTGVLVVEIPSDVQVDSVRLDVGPGLPKTLRWTL
jgi:Ca2+/Na+ antiporter